MSKTITPLEKATGIIINSPEDVILDYKLSSLLLWCWKNDKNLIEFSEMIPDELIDDLVDERFDDLSEHYQQDLLQFALYLNCMKHKSWIKTISHEELMRIINIFLSVDVSTESINRSASKAYGSPLKLIITTQKKKNKYDISAYSLQSNQGLEMEKTNDGFSFKFK